jgi:hypothetical protein
MGGGEEALERALRILDENKLNIPEYETLTSLATTLRRLSWKILVLRAVPELTTTSTALKSFYHS